jgi:hypothetical protein
MSRLIQAHDVSDKKSLFQTRTIGKLPLYVKQNLPHDVVGLN